jgi:hypothetical protein
MQVHSIERQERRVRLETTSGVIEGALLVSPMLRTLDEINVVARTFVTLHEPQVGATDWFSENPLCVRRSSILFVQELSNPPRRSGSSAHGAYTRAALRLRVGAFHVEGFVHVPRGGTALKRLNQGNHSFISLTSVSVLGPDWQFATPFLAVNLDHVQAAQELVPEGPETADELEMSVEGS